MQDGVTLGMGCIIVEHGGENYIERDTDDEQDLIVWMFERVELGQQRDGNPGWCY